MQEISNVTNCPLKVLLTYKRFLNNEGSYLFTKKFEMIDQIIISSNLLAKDCILYDCNSFEIIKPSFMIVQKGDRKGGALPTYMNGKYIGGFSDHFPVGAKFIVKGTN